MLAMRNDSREERILSPPVLRDIALWWATIIPVLIGALFLVDDRLGLVVVGVAVLLAVTLRTLVNRLVSIGRVPAKTGSAMRLASSAIAIGLIFLVGWIVT